ncbi:hypothetical protein EJ05DRAFT_478299 [Pseudovirgaria hyperparasitica]|uniref:2EXR domain-containing protein n=1 Tax=Pseudovirgaria hyperparasitica TaxID=470096 RepID=A0A6A6W5F8_9PEZI|nr:uncharacterized protein EJ05DRAFT_478299 [Pseudovirgaria hyperparasitica]KAF2756291.1 hypothetical protein EJ05DRAFT_478299 [Pseudovirgaria hyperparasitica]
MVGVTSQQLYQSEQILSRETTEAEWQSTQTNSELDNDSDYEPNISCRKRKAKAQKVQKAKRARKTGIAAAQPAKSQRFFRFLDLPPELRNHIYEIALSDTQPVSLCEGWKKYRRIARRQHVRSYHETIATSTNSFVPALLALNKQIHVEAVAVLYSNEFVFADTQAMYNFLAQIGSHRRFVRYITIKEWGWGNGTHKAINHPAMTLLCDAVGLEKFKVSCTFCSHNSKRIAERLYRDGHHWFEAVGHRMKNKTAVFEILEVPKPDINSRYYHSRRYGRSTTEDLKTTVFEELAKLLERK